MNNRITPITPTSWVMLGLVVIASFIAFNGFLNGDASPIDQLLTSNVTTSACPNSFLTIYSANGVDELSICRSGAEGQVPKWQSDGTIAWDTDSTVAVTGAGAVTLDLLDDSSNESTALAEIATSANCNTTTYFAQTFTEPTSDKLLVTCNQPAFTDISGSVTDAQVPDNITIDLATLATSATALASNPADCSANQFANAIAASGDLTCAGIVDADVPNTITIDLAATATALAADPADCAADTKADAIATSGALTCSAVDTGDITDGTILEADLKVVDSPSDEECLTYESTGGDFEWQTCGSSQNLFETVNTTSGTSPVADSPTDTLNIAAGTGITVTGDSGTDTVTIASTVVDTDTHANSFETHSTPSGTSPVADSDTDTLTYTSLTATVDITGSASTDTIDFGVANDAIGVNQLSDGSDVPVAGECVQVAGDLAAFLYGACGGAGANLFETIAVPIGTNPVADDPNDTLTFESPGGTVSITGSASTDTLQFDLDPSGVDNANWGPDTGPFSWTFLIGGTLDPVFNFLDGLISLVTHLLIDNQQELRFGEQDGNGDNYIAVKAPAAVTSNQTCTLEDDATPFDSCITTVTDTHANSFETMNAPAGTDPVADSDTDTLNFTSVNATVAITGDASTDSLDFDAIGLTCTGCIGTGEAAGLDISDDTNLAAGRSLTMSGDSVEADTELYTTKKSITILDPTTGDTNKVQWEYATAYTITEVSCSTDAGTVTIQLDERARATPNTAGTDVMTSTLVCDSNAETTTSFTNAGIAADVPVNLQITAVSTAVVVRIHVKGTKDD